MAAAVNKAVVAVFACPMLPRAVTMATNLARLFRQAANG
jgi:hypothetical protein